MAMTQQQFDSLVERLEQAAERNPGVYKLRLGAFAALGYLYIVVIIGLLLCVAGVLLFAAKAAGAKLALPLLALIGMALRSLWVKLEPPAGLVLARRDHPALFETIEKIRVAAKAPRAHVVLLTNEVNAAIVQMPRLGLFGWQRNYLILGLPLTQLLSLEEFQAVLAHEFGHLSGAHGRFGAWIYRLRTSWSRLAETLHANEHWGRFLFVPFFDWFAPKFAAYSFVQARMQEYEADSTAAKKHGRQSLANALIRLNLKGADLAESYWPGVYKAADDTPAPAGTPFRGLLGPEPRSFLPHAPEQLRRALERRTSTADTHPCLRDRIAALGASAAVPPPLDTPAAAALFGGKLAQLIEHFDAEWRNNVAEWWSGRHQHVQEGRHKLDRYSARPLAELTDEEVFDFGRTTEELVGAERAAELFKALVDRGTNHLGGRYAHARLQLGRGQDAGIAAIEQVMAESPEAVLPGCELIVDYLRSRGRDTEAQPYVDRYVQHQQREQARQRARFTVRTKDTFVPHALSVDSLETLERTLAQHKDVQAAYVVQKVVPAGEPPLHVVGVKRRSRMFRYEKGDADAALVQSLAAKITFPEDILYISVNGDQKAFARKFKKVKGSRIK